MELKQLFDILSDVKVYNFANSLVTGVTDDSRKVEKGFIYIAVKGEKVDGHSFTLKAVELGAVAVIVNHLDEQIYVPQFVVTDTREVVLKTALAFYGNPQTKLKWVGVTGTNGKTTVSTLVYQMLSTIGYQVGLIGTNSIRVGSKVLESKLTTPGAIELAGLIAEIADSGCSHCVMEVSSHALKQHRVKGINYDVALFTNLTRDHLDYHGTVEDYAASKKKLFDSLDSNAVAIVNVDDVSGKTMVSETEASIWDVSLKTGSGAIVLQNDADGLILDLDGIRLQSKLTGTFNAYNILQAYLTCIALGVNQYAAVEALFTSVGAEGRLQKVFYSDYAVNPVHVFVDYAHTPDALENVAKTLKKFQKDDAQFIIVFGCGGNRDKGKRPEMAKIAEGFASKVIITSDNPRFESAEAILNDIEAGFSAKAIFERITDRTVAIKRAISISKPNDIVLIAGKGHETYQEIEGVRYPMDDRKIALDALELKFRNRQTELQFEGVN